MTQKQAIQLFEERKVRTLWDDEAETWYFSILDIIAVLTDSVNPTDYFNKSVDKYINLTNRLLRRFYRGFSNDLENVRNSLLCVIILSNNPCQKQR